MVDGRVAGGGPAMRLDLFLWYVRLAKTRSAARVIAEQGRLRLDGRAIDRAHCPVRVGNILTFVVHDRVRVIRVETLPRRRGPAPEAQACYQELTPGPMVANVSHEAPID